MFARKCRKSAFIGLLALSITLSGLACAAAYSPAPGSTSYVPISIDDLKNQAKKDLANARSAGRVAAQDADKFAGALENASSISAVEQVWADLLAKAQIGKFMHPGIDSLITNWSNSLARLVKNKTVLPAAANPYKERLHEVVRLRKLLYDNDHFYDFWEYIVVAVDLSSLNDKLERALSGNKINVEKLNDLILRSDNYIARNQVCARGLTTFKSFEVEPDQLQQVEQNMYAILKDKAHSNPSLPEVQGQLFKRLTALGYEACSTLPSEADLDTAIVEVQRLLDSGARNGNLSAADAVRFQHELNMIKELKKIYPGANPGIDKVKRELRNEEIRFMSLDLRMMQDWLGRVLRADGSTMPGREQVLRLVRYLDLAMFSHRITEDDVTAILFGLDFALRTSANDDELVQKVGNLQGQLDMMVSDFSLQPAETAVRAAGVGKLINGLKFDQSSACADKDRIQRVINTLATMDGARKYAMSVVTASELEMIRKQVNAMLKAQGRGESN